MSEQCYEPDDFERLLDLPAEHDDQRHLATCAACRSEFDMYRSFMNRDDVPDGAKLDEANVRLSNFLAREIGAEEPVVKQTSSESPGRQWNTRRWSPVLAAACIACVAIFLKTGNDQPTIAPSGVVRDVAGESPGFVTTTIATTNGFKLTWQGPADADSYDVVILDLAMEQVDRIAADASGEVQLDRQDRLWLQQPGPHLWYVIAKNSGDEIARSKVRTLEAGP